MHNASESILLTDLYQLTMLQGYYEQAMHATAVFEFFVRKMPPQRNFFMAAGLEQVLDYLENLHFSDADLGYLETTGRFTPAFLDQLRHFRFTGHVHAMPEGTLFFPNEPVLRITAPLPQAQLVETRIINLLQFQCMVASKSARIKITAPAKLLVDFGLRRAHGAEAGLFAARASYLAGFDGSSTVLAGKLYAMPIYGTMAHSFVQAHDDEVVAFEHFATAQPENVVLLIDTYNTEEAARKVVDLAPGLRKQNITIKAIRLDSGDLVQHAENVRKILDAGGLSQIRIFSSGNLDEYVLADLLSRDAPIDGFGIGTRMVTSSDKPYLDCAYKLEEYDGLPRRKKSEGKATWPGRKQVYRYYDRNGCMSHDILTLHDDRLDGLPLLSQVMQDGKRAAGLPSLHKSREHARHELERLPDKLKKLSASMPYEVKISSVLTSCAAAVDARNEAP